MSRKFYPFALIAALFLVLLFAEPALLTAAQSSGWDAITITPESGNWNTPGHFILEAKGATTVSWSIHCTDSSCGRSDEGVTTHTFTAGEVIKVGWGHQCYAWQFDTIGREGFVANAETELCFVPAAQPTPTATQIPPTPTNVPTVQVVPTETNTPAPQIVPTHTSTPAALIVPTETSTPAPQITPTKKVKRIRPTQTEVPTSVPQVTISQATPTSAPTVAILQATATLAPATPTAQMTPTAAPTLTPKTNGAVLPNTGEAPPEPPLSLVLWPALASLLLFLLGGRLVLVEVFSSTNHAVREKRLPAQNSQARNALILILISLLILAFLVIPPLVRQALIDYGLPDSLSPQAPAVYQGLPSNIQSLSGQGNLPGISSIGQSPQNIQPALQSRQGQNLTQIESGIEPKHAPPYQAAAAQAVNNQAQSPGANSNQAQAAPAGSNPTQANATSIGGASPAAGPLLGGAPAPAGAQAVNPVLPTIPSGPVIRMVIPALKLDANVQKIPYENGTWDLANLDMDIAWLGSTSRPDLGSNTVFAGHITVVPYRDGPFRYLYTLKPGDLIYVYTTQMVYTYSVREQTVVDPNDYTVTGPTVNPQITLLTCTQWDDAAQQYIERRAVFADLVKAEPNQ